MSRFILVAIVTLTISISAAAKDGSATASDQSALEEGSYTYEGLLAIGHGKYVAQDYAGALASYEKAKNSDAGRADAYYFIGCAMAKQLRFPEAVTILKTAATVAGDKDENMHAKALFVTASVWEQAKDSAKAKFAWSEYKEYASSHPSAKVFVSVADEKIAAIETWEKKQAEYQIVRDRISAAATE